MKKNYSNEELTEIVDKLASNMIEQNEIIKDFVHNSLEAHNQHIDLTKIISEYFNSYIDEYNKILKNIVNIILLIECILLGITFYLLYPTLNKIFGSIFSFRSNLTEGWQIALFTLFFSFIFGVISTITGNILYEKIKIKNTSPKKTIN